MDTTALAKAANAKAKHDLKTVEAFQAELAKYLLDAHPKHGDNPKTLKQIIKETQHIPGLPRTESGLSLLATSLGIPHRIRGRWIGSTSPELRERNEAIANEVHHSDKTLEEIAKEHGVTRERIRQVAKRLGVQRRKLQEETNQ